MRGRKRLLRTTAEMADVCDVRRRATWQISMADSWPRTTGVAHRCPGRQQYYCDAATCVLIASPDPLFRGARHLLLFHTLRSCRTLLVCGSQSTHVPDLSLRTSCLTLRPFAISQTPTRHPGEISTAQPEHLVFTTHPSIAPANRLINHLVQAHPKHYHKQYWQRL